MMKGQKGITLVALVITIIVMLILVGVTVTIALGDNGIINKAKTAGQEYKDAQTSEAEANFITNEEINSLAGRE